MIALIVGVVGGFAALLLRGSPLSVANPSTPEPNPTATPPVAVTPPAVTPPASPPVVVQPPAPAPSPVNPPKPPPSPPVASSKPIPKPTTIKPTASTVTKPTLGIKPEPGSGLGGNGPSEPTAMAAKPIISSKPAQAMPPGPVKPAPATSRSQFLQNYRVAVGSFSTATRANGAVAGLRARGLPAIAVPSGNVMVVVVGPYSGETAARNALQRVQSSYPDAILYRPDGSRSRAPSATTSGSPSPSQPAIQDPEPTVTAPDEGAYLQVAAFRNIAGATPLMTRLRGAGYPAFLSSRPDGFTRVLVGPLSRDALQKNRASLQRRGYQPFTVTK